MNNLSQRKTFEEGDEVVMKNAERKGVVTKRRGDFYNVVLEPTGSEEENNVYAGDLVKASRKVFSRIFAKSMDGIGKTNGANAYGNVYDGKLVGKTKGERGENALKFELMASEIADETIRKIMNEMIAKVLQLNGTRIAEKDFEKIAAEMSDELKGALASVLKDKKEIQDKSAVGKYGLLYLLYLYLCGQTDDFLKGMKFYNDNIEKSEQLGLKHGITEMQKKPGEPTANVHGGKAAYDEYK